MKGHIGMQDMEDASAGNTKTTMTNMKMELPETFQMAFQEALQSYLLMKDAFVASDTNQVFAFAKAASKEFKALHTVNLSKMEKSHVSKSVEMLDAISSSRDLEKQRAYFVILNENLVALAMNIDTSENKLYVQQCPMANGNQGAVWISTEEGVKNPYFGDAMLTCGSVIETIN